jgi:hypothetical protein
MTMLAWHPKHIKCKTLKNNFRGKLLYFGWRKEILQCLKIDFFLNKEVQVHSCGGVALT